MTASVDLAKTPAGLRPAGSVTLDAPLRPARTAQLQLQDKVSLTEEGLRRVRDAAASSPAPVERSDADLVQLMRQHAQSPRTGPDLSKQAVVVPVADPNASALKKVLWSSNISDEELGRINQAIDAATPVASRLSNDPAVELTLRKMKLDYIRDALVPESLRDQAGEASLATYPARGPTATACRCAWPNTRHSSRRRTSRSAR